MKAEIPRVRLVKVPAAGWTGPVPAQERLDVGIIDETNHPAAELEGPREGPGHLHPGAPVTGSGKPPEHQVNIMDLVAIEAVLFLGNFEPAPIDSSLKDPLRPRS